MDIYAKQAGDFKERRNSWKIVKQNKTKSKDGGIGGTIRVSHNRISYYQIS